MSTELTDPFSRLPLLQDLERRVPSSLRHVLSSTLIVATQHLLETTGSLLATLTRLGVPPDHVFVMGKHYSSNPSVLRDLRDLGIRAYAGTPNEAPGGFVDAHRADLRVLWDEAAQVLAHGNCERIVVIDDGGRCAATVPEALTHSRRVAVVEQTTSGIWKSSSLSGFPVIDVATSAAKSLIEAPMVARAVARRLPALDKRVACGIVGLGRIGSALAKEMVARGHEVLGFDLVVGPTRKGGAHRMGTLQDLLSAVSYLFGCTGSDVLENAGEMRWSSRGCALVSCSSEDIEFRRLLLAQERPGPNWSPLGDVAVRPGDAGIRILRGGFPFNFDGSRESVPADEIQLTRALLLAGVLQAISEGQPSGRRMLSPTLQRLIVQSWFGLMPSHRLEHGPAVLTGFHSDEWVAARSGGMRGPERHLEQAVGVPD